MKVYIVTEGIYSEYHIDSVFTVKDQADKRAALISGEVEEWETDEIKIEGELVTFYQITYYPFCKEPIMRVNQRAIIAGSEPLVSEINLKGNHNLIDIVADDEDKACKIFYDKYSQAMAEYYLEGEGARSE